ncbi:MAG: hypothetical protein JJU36_02325 [Phycisphaeraceae bacterium]|nr:hypothetical protein [Phycisphaeraceae bacterium]
MSMISSLANHSAPPTKGSAFGELSSDKFIKVLISELTNQDPFKPQDSSAMLEQLSSLRNIESQMALQDQIGKLVQQNQVASSGAMIGRSIEGIDMTGQTVRGAVRGVHIHDGKVQLELEGGAVVPMDKVTRLGSSESDLVGKGIEAVRENGEPVTGIVRAVRSLGGTTVLELKDGLTVPLIQVRRFFDPVAN